MSEIGQPQPEEIVQPKTLEQHVDTKKATPFTHKFLDFFKRFKAAEVQIISKQVESSSVPEPTPTTSENTETKKKLITRRTALQLLGATALTPLLGKAHLGAEFVPFPNDNNGRLEVPTANPEIVIKELFGVDPKEYGMESMLQIPSTSGKYIVHLGQIHTSGEYIMDVINDEGEVSQANIEKFLLDANIKHAYLEGTTEKSIEYVDSFKVLQEDNIKTLPNTYEGLLLLSTLNTKVLSQIGLEGLGYDMWNYIMIKKMIEIKQALKENPSIFVPEQEPVNEVLVEELGIKVGSGSSVTHQSAQELISNIESLLSIKDSVGINLRLGTGIKMYFDDTLEIHHAETVEENKEGHTAIMRVISLQDQLQRALYIDKASEEKIANLVAELEEAKSAHYKETMSDREGVAIDIVTESPQFKDAKVSTIIYGAAHDFSEEVMRANAANPNEQRGLIYLTPKSMMEQ